jgi:hypothetical protein
MATVEIVDPRAEMIHHSRGAGPALPQDLDGVVVAMCTDDLWPSYDSVAAAWTSLLEARGAKVVQWRASQAARHDGTDSSHVPADFVPLAQVLPDVDFAVVGLGNCGSCTNRTIDDTVEVLEAGVGAVAVVTSEFEAFARILAKRQKWADMRVQVLPYPLVTLPKEDIQGIAEDSLDGLLTLCRSGR